MKFFDISLDDLEDDDQNLAPEKFSDRQNPQFFLRSIIDRLQKTRRFLKWHPIDGLQLAESESRGELERIEESNHENNLKERLKLRVVSSPSGIRAAMQLQLQMFEPLKGSTERNNR